MTSARKYPFAEVVLSGGAESYAFIRGFDGEKRLRPLSKLNIFVGANNSGKSRLMRLLAATAKLNVVPNLASTGGEVSWDLLHSTLAELKVFAIGAVKSAGYNNWNGIEGTTARFPLDGYVTEGTSQIDECFSTIERMTIPPRQPNTWFSDVSIGSAVDGILSRAKEAHSKLAAIEEASRIIPETKKLYIPTLRSLRDLGSGDTFEDRTKQDYFQNAGHIQMFTGRTLYSEIEKLVRGDLAQRETLRRFETWVGETFFRGEQVAIIPRMGQTTLTIKIGDEQEQPVHNLGDGIQAILILAFPLFVRENEHLLAFIEEPELFLHPWLQRVLLEMLSTRFPHHQYFLTTHSNHFLDLTLDIESVSVFAFEKHLEKNDGRERPPRYEVTNVSRSDRRPLELLGVRNSSVLLTNCTIWIEGITDRRYVAHWLDLYQQQLHGNTPAERAKFFKEDLHYSFVEYSGGNITHWSFLDEEGPDVDRLCGKLFLIADNDRAKPESEKGKRHAKLAEKLKNRFYLLPVREIENLLTPEVLKRVLEAYGETGDNLGTPIQDAYASELLGNFIEERFIKDPAQKKRKASYAGDSGTVSDKVKFCERAIETMTSFDSLSPAAQELAKKVFYFIKEAQQH
jgi:hypothetical protein